ncbi:MAG: heat-shock protein Hsp90 [Selenomonadaceae bacterium]|nr:heat-shock protein Hsp90 [Selenomonadaceae bacterium]
MDKQTLIAKMKEMAAAPSCCPELKEAVAAYIDAFGTPNEKTAAKNLLAEIKEDITTVDGLVAFAHSPQAAEIFGEGIKGFIAHAEELKASGAEYCDCAACAINLPIAEKRTLHPSKRRYARINLTHV